MSKFVEPELARAVKVVNASCGCICEFPLKGLHANLREWHIIVCRDHHANIAEMEQWAERCWQSLRRDAQGPSELVTNEK